MRKRYQKLVAEARKNIDEISPQDVARATNTGEPLIIGVREPEESRLAHIPNAKTISRGTLETEIEEIAPSTDTPIICYCGGGGRSALASESLQRMGYTNVKSIAGGFKAWKAAGLPVQQ